MSEKMKDRVFLLMFMALNVITAYCQRISSASVVFTGDEILTPCDIIPLWFEEGALKNDRDTIVIEDKDEVNEIVNVVKSLKLSDSKTLDVRGWITVYYDSPETHVYNDIITRGIWKKIGKLPVRDDLEVLPNQYIRHNFRYDLYNPNTGEITPSCREEAVGLECCAVWDDFHVVDRLRCRYNGTHCTWLSDELEYFLEIYDE